MASWGINWAIRQKAVFDRLRLAREVIFFPSKIFNNVPDL
jgi:hypothetical protein